MKYCVKTFSLKEMSMNIKNHVLFFRAAKAFFLIFFCSKILFSNEITPQANAYKSQFGQDKFVNEQFFKNKKNGVFVDIGAHNGVTFSNSHFFEKELGWNGICVEPIPAIFNQLQNNRKCVCVQGCVTNFDGAATFAEVVSSNVETQMLSGLYLKYDPRQIQRISAQGGQLKYFEVPCYTPKSIFEVFKISYIDFLSIDTEGGEFDILLSIDLAKVDIDVITIEVNYPEDKRIYNYLTTHNYRFVQRLVCDEIYKKIR